MFGTLSVTFVVAFGSSIACIEGTRSKYILLQYNARVYIISLVNTGFSLWRLTFYPTSNMYNEETSKY